MIICDTAHIAHQNCLFKQETMMPLSFKHIRGSTAEGFAITLYHARTLWLFTYSDLKTIVIPSTLFGITNSFFAPYYHIAVPQHNHGSATVIGRWALTMLWVWLNLLPFAINNQRAPAAIAEDSINKPWRPMPCGRLSAGGANATMVFFYILAQLCSVLVTGGLRQSLGLVHLGVWYNNLGGGDGNPLIRNAINALGYVCFTSGALEVAVGTDLPFTGSPRLVQWFGTIAGIIMTTVHSQDMYDQEGDQLRGRKTVPLVVGDVPARWTIAVWMLIWGALGPHLWQGPVTVRCFGLALSGLIGVRSLVYREVSSDKTTFLLWNFWMCFVYVLPACSAITKG